MPGGVAVEVEGMLLGVSLARGVGRVERAQPGVFARAALEHGASDLPEDAIDADGLVEDEQHVSEVPALESFTRFRRNALGDVVIGVRHHGRDLAVEIARRPARRR